MSTVLERFLRYVQIDTQSDAGSRTYPSTEKQKDLGRLLVQELQAMGYADAELDPYGIVYATIPPTPGQEDAPIICLCAHMDTSPDVSGAGVKPIIHANYRGQDIALPDDRHVVLSAKADPDLLRQIGNDVVTASGTTLLGADNKAGVAEIMTMAEILSKPDHGVEHGRIRLLFTCDEEIGRGTDKVDLAKLGADFAYTFDGEELGTLEDETWSADGAVVRFTGISAHPGFAKGHMVSALKAAAHFVELLPKAQSAEETEGRQGFIHPVSISGTVEAAEVQLILRSFTLEGLAGFAENVRNLSEKATLAYPGSKSEVIISAQYRNMKEALDARPEVVERALAAMHRAGLTPERRSIRGGTDGSRLTAMGLPCPNVFAGEHAFHSRTEWVSVQDMEAAVRVALEIVRV